MGIAAALGTRSCCTFSSSTNAEFVSKYTDAHVRDCKGEANTSYSQPMVTRYNHKKRKDEERKDEQKTGNNKRKQPQQPSPSDTNLKQ